MSSFDIGNVIYLLQSKKIKDRNDGLNDLELLTLSHLMLSSKQFRILIVAVIDLIEIEVNSYKTKPSVAIENRLSLASGSIKIIVEKTINNTDIKSKILTDYIKNIIDLINDNFDVLLSNLVDFMTSIESILKLSYVKDHLNHHDYHIILKFLSKIIDFGNKSSHHEKILIHSYSCLSKLLNCDELSSTIYLQIYNNQDYKLILPLLSYTIEKTNRENIICLYCFKIINKLLVILSTEDIESINFLIKLGIDILLVFNASNSNKLQQQFLIFLNLSPVTKFINLAKFNTLVDNLNHDSNDSLINKISSLIQQLINKLNSLDFEFEFNDFHVSIYYNSKIFWCDLKTISLATSNYKPWLLALGIINLLTIYFDLKLEDHYQDNILGFNNISKSKRQKLEFYGDILHQSNHILSFLNKLIATKNDLKSQKTGLQLLVFYLQWYSSTKLMQSKKINKMDSESSSNGYEEKSISDSIHDFDLNLILKSTLNTFEKVDLHFWSSLASQSLFMDSLAYEKPIKSKLLYQLLTIFLQILKVPTISKVVCASTFYLVRCIQNQNSFHVFDKPLVNQLENLIELSDINGPSDIDDLSIALWYSIHDIVNSNKSLKMKSEIYPKKLQEWVLSKWDRANPSFYNAIKVPSFIAWICGVSVPRLKTGRELLVHNSVLDVQELLLLMLQREEFVSYLALNDKNNICLTTKINNENLKLCQETENFILTILKRSSSHLLLNEKVCSKFQEAVLLLTIAQSFPKHGHYSHIVDSIKNQSIYFFESLKDLTMIKEKIEVVRAFNLLAASLDSLVAKSIADYVPLELFCNQILKQNNLEVSPKNKKFSVFDDDSRAYEEEKNSEILNTIILGACNDPLKEAVNCIFKVYRLNERDYSVIIPTMVANLENLTQNRLALSLASLVDQVMLIPVGQFSTNSLNQLVRFVGLIILMDYKLERSELTYVSISKLLNYLAPMLKTDIDQGFKKDCYDMCNWLIECDQQSVITTELGNKECFQFLISFLEMNDGSVISNERLKALLFRRVKNSTNFLRSEMAREFVNLVRKLDVTEQIEFYRNTLLNYPQPDLGIESSASFVFFFCHLSESSSKILQLTIFNLLECSGFATISMYLEHGLDFICNSLGISSRIGMFKSMKLILLKWWFENNDLDSFPYKLFGYSEKTDFLHDNYRELTAIIMSVALKGSNNLNILKSIADSRHSDSLIICSESFSLAIPLSFTEKGKKNQIFDDLPLYLDSHYKRDLQEKLLLTVFDIILLTDMSREDAALSMYKDNSVAKRILVPQKLKSQELGARINISLATSSQLLEKFIQKYYKKGEFWLTHNTYFLLRRMFVVLNNSFFIDDRSASLKRIKLILILGFKCINNFAISQILIHNLCPLLSFPNLRDDILMIFNTLKLEEILQFGIEKTVPLITQVLSSMLTFGVEVTNSEFLSSIQAYVCNNISNNILSLILKAAIAMVRRLPIIILSDDIENFLKDEDAFSLCLVSNSSDSILSLVSNVFKSVKLTESSSFSEVLVNVIINASGKVRRSYSKEFKLWTSKYLANFYLEGGLIQESSKVFEIRELSDISIDNFEETIRVLDYGLNALIEFSKEGDTVIAGCGENVISVLLYKYHGNKDEIEKYLNFEGYFKKYENYIVPLDIHTSMIMNEESSLQFSGSSLTDILNSFASFLDLENYEVWTTKLLLAILQEVSIYTSIAPLLSNFAMKVHLYAAKVIPFFICYYIHLRGSKGAEIIQQLLAEFCRIDCKDEKAINLFIRLVLMIRIGARKGLTTFGNVLSEINLLKFYHLAASNKLPKTALLIFEEIYCDDTKILDWNLESKTLSSVYESLNDVDLVNGIPERTTVEYALSMINRGEDTQNQLRFSSAIFDANITLKSSTMDSASIDHDMISSLSNSGLSGISRVVSGTIGSTLENDSFDWSWKLNQWDLPIPNKLESGPSVIYGTLKQINDYPSKSLEICENTLLSLLDYKDELLGKPMSCKDYSDTMQTWFQTLGVVHSLRDILSYDESNFQSQITNYLERTSWYELSDTSYSENILKARQILFQILSRIPPEESNLSFNNVWLGCLHELVRYNISSQSSVQQQKIISSSMLIDDISKSKFKESKWLLENTEKLAQYHVARAVWSQGITDIPIAILKDLASRGNIVLPLQKLSVDVSLINATLVGWMAISRQDLASNIMEKYVLPTAEAVDSIADLSQMAKVFHLLANFCEKQYKSRNLNEEIIKLEKRVKSKVVEIDKLKAFYLKASVDAEEKKRVQRFYGKLKAQCNSEELDLKASRANKERFSMKAVEFYLKSISSIDDDEDEDVDKFFAIWLELSTNNDLNRNLSRIILDLPSFKLISWSIQLISRLSNEETEFQKVLQDLVFKMCSDHPYHTLYQLLSLKLHKDYVNGSNDELKLSKYDAASDLWNRLLNDCSNSNRKLLTSIEMFSREALKLAEHKVQKGRSIQLSRLNVGKFWLEDIPRIPPPTMTISIHKTANYSDVPTILRVDSKVIIATSGLSLPKILTFHLSNGTQHRMLIKFGADDLRQDSIMEQVFEKVNHMLMKDKETRKRNLHIRTYKAIPMGPKSGMIEFVPNSVSLIDVIKPYHVKNDEMTLEKARELMRACQSGEKQQRYEVYKEITTKVKPILRHFFFDTFLTPDPWFESRLKYTHGIATTSIVGHILGLGDRHCNNILLDQQSGEPIHIDLGVAFDQGKRLPIPETVPFRLTRDIVDGFGVTGVNGVFRKSCEHTFRVLRTNTDHILSILDVLRWDPLYSWNISTMKKQRLQDETGGVVDIVEDGSEAGRAVLTVSDKLFAAGLSVEAAVRELVQEATNPHNLALIYLGWCPFY